MTKLLLKMFDAHTTLLNFKENNCTAHALETSQLYLLMVCGAKPAPICLSIRGAGNDWRRVKRCGYGQLWRTSCGTTTSRLCATPVTSCTTQSGRTCCGSTSAFERAWMRVCGATVETSRRKCVGSSLGGAECGAGCCASFVTTVLHEWVQNVLFWLVPVCVPSCGVW